MSTTKTFNNIKSGKRHQIDATARGYYDFRTTVVPQPNKPLSYDMKVYDGLKYGVDLSKNSVRPGEINFDGTVLPYVENNTLTKTNYCFGNSGTNYDLPVYNKEYVNINKIGDFDIDDGIVSNFYRDHYLTVTLPNYLSGSVNSFEICMKVHTPTNNTSNGRILNSTDSYDNLAVDLGSNPGFNFCGGTIGFGSQFDADIDLWVKVQFDGTNLSLHHSLNGVDYIQDNSKSWSKSNVWFTSNTYSIGLRSYDFVDVCFFNGTIDLNECYVKINDEIINFGENTLQKQYTGYTLEGNASIKGSICSGFDSNSRLYVENWNLDISKDNIFIFTTGNSVTENQVLLMVDETNDALQFFIGNSKLEYNSGSISEYTAENLEPNTLYKVKIHRQDEHTYVFSLSKNDGAFSDEKTITSNLFSDTYTNRITVGNYSSHSSPFQGTIDLSEMYNLLSIVTESKTGIFQDYEDNGKAKTLNAFSSNNELVVLSPNENIVDYTWLGTVNIPKHIINWGQLNNWYNWTSQVNELGEWVEGSLPASIGWKDIAYGNGKYVIIARDSSIYTHSEDGINWTQGTLPLTDQWSIKFGNNKFVVTNYTSSNFMYSEDGINWTTGSTHLSGNGAQVSYGNNKFVIINTNSTDSAFVYSEDGINWTQGTLPISGTKIITYVNDRFIILYYNSTSYVYSEDGINWTQGTLPISDGHSISYGNGKYVIVMWGNSTYLYSSDGINWTQGTLPITKEYNAINYDAGYFIVTTWSDNVYLYSKDGINWVQGTMPSSGNWAGLLYNDNKFTAYNYNGNTYAYLPVTSQELSVYTSKEKPTIDSLVYSNPNVESELTITNVGENNITLSDNNVYVRNPSGDTSTSKPSTPDAPTIDLSALKFGDRIDNKATVVGTFDSNDGKKYVYAVLDSSYYDDKSWSTDIFNDGTNTGLPDYTSAPTSQNHESATYNTNYILTNYSDKATEAFTYCRSIEPLNFNGETYNCQLPNAYELQQIYNNRAKLYELDPTTSTNTSYNLAEWDFFVAWSSNERNTDSSWCLGKGNSWENSDYKDMVYTVIPIIEIPLLK